MLLTVQRLVCKGKTTLEFCEKKRNTKYDFGTYGNLKRVLGRNPFLWMLPLGKYLFLVILIK